MTREEAIKIIGVAIAETEWNYPMNYSRAFEKAIEALKEPERVHARWSDSLDGITPYCTNCHKSHRWMTRTPSYCPNCGAIMDEERKDTE